MLGTKFYKDDFNQKDYAEAAAWCNVNSATITDMGKYYEVTEIPAPTEDEQAALDAAQAEAEKEELRKAWIDNQIETAETPIGEAFRAVEGITLDEAITKRAALETGIAGELGTGEISGATKG